MVKIALILSAALVIIVVVGLAMVAEEQRAKGELLRKARLPVRGGEGGGPAITALVLGFGALALAYIAGGAH